MLFISRRSSAILMSTSNKVLQKIIHLTIKVALSKVLLMLVVHRATSIRLSEEVEELWVLALEALPALT